MQIVFEGIIKKLTLKTEQRFNVESIMFLLKKLTKLL